MDVSPGHLRMQGSSIDHILYGHSYWMPCRYSYSHELQKQLPVVGAVAVIETITVPVTFAALIVVRVAFTLQSQFH